MNKTVPFSAVRPGWVFFVPTDDDAIDYIKRADGSVTRDGMITMTDAEASAAFAETQCIEVCPVA